MWMDSYVEDIVIRERIAEARRAGARAELLRRARRAATPRRPWAVMKHVVAAISTLWLGRA